MNHYGTNMVIASGGAHISASTPRHAAPAHRQLPPQPHGGVNVGFGQKAVPPIGGEQHRGAGESSKQQQAQQQAQQQQ